MSAARIRVDPRNFSDRFLTIFYLMLQIKPHVSFFAGSLPSTLANSTHLRTLTCEGNMLTGTLPPDLGSLPELTVLRLTNNDLEGEVPLSVEQSRNLTQLHLAYNSFTAMPWGSMLTALHNPLTSVVLANNRIEVSLNNTR